MYSLVLALFLNNVFSKRIYAVACVRSWLFLVRVTCPWKPRPEFVYLFSCCWSLDLVLMTILG